MNLAGSELLLAALVLLVLVVVAVLLRKRSKLSVPEVEVAPVPLAVAPKPIIQRKPESRPNRIVIGESPSAPVLTIRPVSSLQDFGAMKAIDPHSTGAIGRLGPLFQAVPSLLVAGEATGKHLMEVVVNGNLVRAADGNGYRAFVMGTGGIQEQARLFDVSRLQTMINAAAIWQVASVLVAQKHLADISAKLEELKKGVAGISRFLDNQRKSRISGTYEYLSQLYHAIQLGELAEATRNQLEACERDLLEIQDHLVMEYKQKVDAKVEVSEMGTGEQTTGIAKKLDDLDLVAQDMAVCLKTRIAAWHVLSLFPGDPHLKAARRESIQKSILKFAELGPYGRDKLKSEIFSIDSFWNKKETLEARRKSLSDKNAAAVQNLSGLTEQGLERIRSSEQFMLESDRPTHLLLQIENGVIVGARQRA